MRACRWECFDIYYVKKVQVAAFSEINNRVVPNKAMQVGKIYKKNKNVTRLFGTSEQVVFIVYPANDAQFSKTNLKVKSNQKIFV